MVKLSEIAETADKDIKCARCGDKILKGTKFVRIKGRLCFDCAELMLYSKVNWYHAIKGELESYEELYNDLVAVNRRARK